MPRLRWLATGAGPLAALPSRHVRQNQFSGVSDTRRKLHGGAVACARGCYRGNSYPPVVRDGRRLAVGSPAQAYQAGATWRAKVPAIAEYSRMRALRRELSQARHTWLRVMSRTGMWLMSGRV
jgi:hypothetical protein